MFRRVDRMEWFVGRVTSTNGRQVDYRRADGWSGILQVRCLWRMWSRKISTWENQLRDTWEDSCATYGHLWGTQVVLVNLLLHLWKCSNLAKWRYEVVGMQYSTQVRNQVCYWSKIGKGYWLGSIVVKWAGLVHVNTTVYGCFVPVTAGCKFGKVFDQSHYWSNLGNDKVNSISRLIESLHFEYKFWCSFRQTIADVDRISEARRGDWSV